MNIFKKYFLLPFFLFIAFSFSFLSAQHDKFEKIDSFINKAMTDWKMTGFAVAIVKNDSVYFSKGYGVCEAGKNQPVDGNTLFVIASCSKAFTTASLAILVDQNKINWDDAVIKYLPDFQMSDPWITTEITIRDLVTHRSGLATFSGDFLWLSSTYNRKEVIRRARYLKPTSSFRTKYGYQNIMFITAAEIIKAVTDTAWGDFIHTHIRDKLNMKNSNTSYAKLHEAKNIALPHYSKNGEMKIYPDVQRDNAQGALGINSSANDMAQWIRLQLAKGNFNGQEIYSVKQSNEMWANQFAFGNRNYGLGWFINYKNGKRIINHGGGMPGMISDVTLVPEENFGFVILSNLESGMVNTLRNFIIDIMTNVEPKDYQKLMLDAWQKRLDNFDAELKKREEIRIENTNPSLPLEKYCGIYEDKMYGKAGVSLKDGNLFLQFYPTPTFKGVLHHYQYDIFYIDWEDEFLTRGWMKFDMDFNGTPNKITFEVPNSPDFIFTELSFTKVE